MELYIRVADGKAVEHPILGDNFREAFPDIDTDNLPSGFAKFVRVAQPTTGPYEVYEGVTYELSGDVFTDVHQVRTMTEQEKTDKQDQVKSSWATNGGYASWVFDADTCSFKPPVDYPTDGKNYNWNETTTSWDEIVSPIEIK